MERIKVNVKGIRANVKATVTVYTLGRGCLRFGKIRPLEVRCSFFRIVTTRDDDMKIRTRRVKVGQSTEKAV